MQLSNKIRTNWRGRIMACPVNNRFSLWIGLLLVLLAGGCANMTPRKDVLVKDGWRFVRRDFPDAQNPGLDDSQWQKISLPHTYNALDGQDGGSNYFRGPAWYRVHVAVDSDDAKKQMILRFEAASLAARVYANGQYAGEHRGGFAAFCFNVTSLVHAGDNLISVRVDNSPDPDIPLTSGDFTVCGGLYRNVHLLALNPISISPTDDASPGVYLTPTHVDAASADVQITTVIRNDLDSDQNVTAACTITDAAGNVVATGQAEQSLAAHSSAQASHKLDPNRLTTSASHLPAKYAVNWIPDIHAFNRYFGWYTGTVSERPDQLDKLHDAFPDRDIGISQYGAGAGIFQHQVHPMTQPLVTGRWHPEEWQAIVHETAYAAMKQRPWLWGTYVWCMFDFACDDRNEGDQPGRNDKGLVTIDRAVRKDAFFFYKANWSSAPFVYITSRRFNPHPAGTVQFKVYSNCDSIELIADHKPPGVQSSIDHVFVSSPFEMTPGPCEIGAAGKKRWSRIHRHRYLDGRCGGNWLP